MTHRALLSFMTLPRSVRFLWLFAAFLALNMILRLAGL
jgi:hypothetical protein